MCVYINWCPVHALCHSILWRIFASKRHRHAFKAIAGIGNHLKVTNLLQNVGRDFLRKMSHFFACPPPTNVPGIFQTPTQNKFSICKKFQPYFAVFFNNGRGQHAAHAIQEKRDVPSFDLTPMGGAWAVPARGQGRCNTGFSLKTPGSMHFCGPESQAKCNKQSSLWPPETAVLERKRSRIWGHTGGRDICRQVWPVWAACKHMKNNLGLKELSSLQTPEDKRKLVLKDTCTCICTHIHVVGNIYWK